MVLRKNVSYRNHCRRWPLYFYFLHTLAASVCSPWSVLLLLSMECSSMDLPTYKAWYPLRFPIWLNHTRCLSVISLRLPVSARPTLSERLQQQYLLADLSSYCLTQNQQKSGLRVPLHIKVCSPYLLPDCSGKEKMPGLHRKQPEHKGYL